MKRFIAKMVVSLCCVGAMDVSAIGLNEWTFDHDAAGLTLSQATNSGAQSAVFSSGGEGFLETDGNGSLLCTRAAGSSNEMWTGGAILDADVANATSGVRYFRVDCTYDLTSTNNISGTAFGLIVLDESGTRVAGMTLMKGEQSAPAGSELKHIQFLNSSGQLSAVLKVDMDAGTMTSWYSFDGGESFDENQPAASDIPMQLTSIDKLRFQATGDFRPAGSSDYAAADIIRTASSWETIILPASVPLSVHNLFQDKMVLQRDMNTPIWGNAMPGAAVTVKLDGATIGTATAGDNGKWLARIDPQNNDGGLAHILQVSSGAESIQFNNVVFGDVYLASGQSNMEMPMAGYSAGPVIGYSEELAVADSFPLIRHVAVSKVASLTKLDEPDLRINWTQCSQASLGDFSAVGYFFAKKIYQETGVPVGLLFSAWGGQKIERFTSPSGMEAVPELAGLLQAWEDGLLSNYFDIYNAMIAPLVPYGIKGVIWYQGENNSNDGDIYTYKMQAFMRGWREEWGQGNFPFYYVQLANYDYPAADFPMLRKTQLAVLSETNCGMAVTIDVGDDSDIHPRNKYDVGVRLARWALAKDYDRDIIYSGPLFQSAVPEGSQMRIFFDYADSGLIVGQKESTNAVVETGGPLQNFEIAGADTNYVAAEAVIDRDTVLVSAASVPSPMYVRYCYACAPSGSNKLYNAAGLPASPFSTSSLHILNVINGTGDDVNLISGTTNTIYAYPPASGKVFDRWTGAVSEIAGLNLSPTIVTLPNHSLFLTPSYRDTTESSYQITVNNGIGGGTSKAGALVGIEATVPEGQAFDHWAGDTQTVNNVDASCTLLRMPAAAVTVTAVFYTIDSVGDGISDNWRATYFGGDGSSTNSQSAASADPDGDGMTNEQEFRAGTSPIDAQSKFYLTGTFSGSNAAIHFSTVGGRHYLLEKSATLVPPAWETVFYSITGDGKQKALQMNLDDAATEFYRIQVNGS